MASRRTASVGTSAFRNVPRSIASMVASNQVPGSEQSSRHGHVHGLIQQLMDRGNLRSAHDLHSGHLPVQHGTAEHQRSRRERSRDRASRSLGAQSARPRTPTELGPQNALDVANVFDEINRRLDDIENTQRRHAQAISRVEATTGECAGTLKEVIDDIGKYKEFMTSTHRTIEIVMNDKDAEVRNHIEAALAVIGPNVETFHRQGAQVLRSQYVW